MKGNRKNISEIMKTISEQKETLDKFDAKSGNLGSMLQKID